MSSSIICIFNFQNIKAYLRKPYFNENFGNEQDSNGVYRSNLPFVYYISNSKDFIHFLYEQLREFTKIFEQYLIKDVLSTLKEESPYMLVLQSIGIQQGNRDVHILSFNYTDTCEKLYNKKPKVEKYTYDKPHRYH